MVLLADPTSACESTPSLSLRMEVLSTSVIARMWHSLIRVTRRVGWPHFVSISSVQKWLTPAVLASRAARHCTQSPTARPTSDREALPRHTLAGTVKFLSSVRDTGIRCMQLRATVVTLPNRTAFLPRRHRRTHADRPKKAAQDTD